MPCCKRRPATTASPWPCGGRTTCCCWTWYCRGVGGLEILRQVRAARPTQPVIILTARGEERDRVEGLRMGADDYVVKPFSVKELMARVEAVLRRSPERPSDVQEIALSDGVADLARREARFEDGGRTELSETRGGPVAVSGRQRPAGRSRGMRSLPTCGGISPQGISTRTIDMHVARLREKLRDDAEKPQVVLTVRGKGYMFAAPVASSEK